jgi:cellulose synthase/poly-beta-1,6-N-acetylglucosamine synthase-like glycosyltransferase
MKMLEYLLLIFYVSALFSLLVYGMNCYYLMSCYRIGLSKARERHLRLKETFTERLLSDGWPRATIQLPIFNERYVAQRLVRAVCQLDYPKQQLEIQVLDDSTDDTVKICRDVVQEMRQQGFDIVHVHRGVRTGFKAGALKEGLERVKSQFIGIFDADFIPCPEFLRETIPYFVDPRVGMVQARWGHLNADYSMLTRAQSMGIDGHFGVEQAARSWTGLFMNFNGTAGIWRKEAILDAGGWQADTLTEDLDLSYRAQLKGWKLEFAPELMCPAEIPVSINGFKSQQYRWAKGSIETAKKNLGRLFRADLPLLVKIQSFLHLTHYMVHPLMIIVVLSSIPMLTTGWFFANISYPIVFFMLFCLATFGPSNMYLFSQKILYPDWKSRIKYLPFLMCLGTGIAANNTRAIVGALLGLETGFVRTPKYGIEKRADTWYGKRYTVPVNAVSIFELLLGLYSLTGLVLFFLSGRYLISPFLLIYSAGFLYVFSLSVLHGYAKSRTVLE